MHNRFNIENLKSENVIICNLNDNIIIYLPGQKSTDQENDIILDESVFNTYNDLETCVVTSYVELFKINGINIYKKNLGKVINLPKPNIDDQETFYIVDYDVAMTGHIFCGRERKDLLLTGKSFLKDNTKLYTHLTFFESVLNTNPIIYDCSLSIKWKPQAFKNKLSTSIDSVNIINLSGLETISIYDKSNTIRIFPSMGYAYCDINLSKRLEIDSVPIYTRSFNGIIGLPEYNKSKEIFYIVSNDIFILYYDKRDDLLVAEGLIEYSLVENCYERLVNKISCCN